MSLFYCFWLLFLAILLFLACLVRCQEGPHHQRGVLVVRLVARGPALPAHSGHLHVCMYA